MFETIVGFLMANIWSVGVAAVFLIACILLWANGYKKSVALVCLQLIAIAEQKFEHGENFNKLNMVIDELYKRFPVLVKFFCSREMLVKFVNRIVAESKEWLQSQTK